MKPKPQETMREHSISENRKEKKKKHVFQKYVHVKRTRNQVPIGIFLEVSMNVTLRKTTNFSAKTEIHYPGPRRKKNNYLYYC